MKKFYLIMAFVAASLLTANADSYIYAYQTWQPRTSTPKRGPVAIDPNNPGNVLLLNDQSSKGVCYSGFYYNYKWYAQGMQAGTQSTFEGFYTIDIQTGERTLAGSQGSKMVDMTYDYSTDRVYGVQSGNEYLATLDITTGAVTRVAKFSDGTSDPIYVIALAADLDGQLYAIATNDNFYTVDKTTAKCTLVGSTGIDAAYDQSMAFDYNTGKLYWVNNGDYYLYTIDTATGKATIVGAVKYDSYPSSIGGLMVPYIKVAKGAPDRVIYREAKVSGSDVTLSWRNPTLNAQSEVLTAFDGVKVLRDGAVIATIDAATAGKGADVTYTDEGLTEGLHTYKFIPFNTYGDGGVDTDDLQVNVGADAPGAVENFTAVSGDSEALLSWTKPTMGATGGIFDPASVTGYVIRRLAQGNTTATEIKVAGDASSYADPCSFGRYTYSIAAVNEAGEGIVTTVPQIIVKPADWIIPGQGKVATVETGKKYYFYDAAGPDAYYYNNSNDTITIAPASAGAYVTARFTDFALDTYADTLSIYNGKDVKAPLLGKFTAEAVPVELELVEATNATGALTFVFTSDVMGRDKGWAATIEAVESKSYDLAVTDLKANLYPAVNTEVTYSVSILNKGVNAADGYTVKLVDASGATLAQSAGVKIEPFATATVTVKHTFAEVGEVSVHAYIDYEADLDLTNNTSADLDQRIIPTGSKYVEINAEDPTELYILPTSFMAEEFAGQTIYAASLVNADKGSVIEMISYPIYDCSTTYRNVPMQVWVGETDKDVLSEASIPASQLTKVFDGKVDVKSGDEALVIPTSTKYTYQGGNLVIMTYKRAADTGNYGVTFRGTYGDYTAEHEYSRFDSNYDFPNSSLDLEAFGNGGSTIVPDVAILFEPASGVSDVAADAAAVVKTADGAIVVSGNASQAVAVFSIDGRAVYFADGVTDATIEVAPGAYIVKAGATVVKVILK